MLKKFYQKNRLEAGCDEAGRGCLSGPVVAAAVILPKKISKELSKLNDSKKLTEKQRDKLRPIIEKEALSWAVGIVSPKKIDQINILNASFLAMQKAVDKLYTKPELLLIDGNRFNKHKKYEHVCIIKGDEKYMSIAAASVLAKTYRDDIMKKQHKQFPVYGWDKNKGYPTKAHRNAIRENGTTKYHRMTFRLLPEE